MSKQGLFYRSENGELYSVEIEIQERYRIGLVGIFKFQDKNVHRDEILVFVSCMAKPMKVTHCLAAFASDVEEV